MPKDANSKNPAPYGGTGGSKHRVPAGHEGMKTVRSNHEGPTTPAPKGAAREKSFRQGKAN